MVRFPMVRKLRLILCYVHRQLHRQAVLRDRDVGVRSERMVYISIMSEMRDVLLLIMRTSDSLGEECRKLIHVSHVYQLLPVL
jgi:hypothetical protein